MKKLSLLLVICLFISTLASCVETSVSQDSDTDDNTSESSQSTVDISENTSSDESEEKKEWTEVEEIGNERVTREYRDGENDYTVTVESFYNDGSLYQKKVIDYKNGIKISDKIEVYEKNGSYDITITDNDNDGNVEKIQTISYSGRYVKKSTFNRTDEANGSIHKIEYTTLDGTVVATGTWSLETFNGVECCGVEKLDVFEDGEIVRRQTTASCTLGDYVYWYSEIVDLNGNIILSKEVKENTITEHLVGEDGIKVVVEGTLDPAGSMVVENSTSYYESNGKFIASGKDSIINSVGAEYKNIDVAKLLNDRITKLQEAYKLFISLS